MLRQVVVFWITVSMLVAGFTVVSAQDDCEFEEDTVRFGALAPQSAPGSVVAGVAMSWAFQRAAEDINAECGIQIDGKNYRLEILVADSEGLPERSQAATERLIFENDIDGMVGVYHSAVGLATMGILQENHIPTVYSEPWNDDVTASGIAEFEGRPARVESNENGIDYIFRIAPTSSMVSNIVIEWLLAQGVEDVVIIGENTDFGIPATEADQALLEAAGVAVETIFIELGTEDFVPILSRIQARPEPPDAIRLQITGETSFNITQQMAELGIAPTTDTMCVTFQDAFQSEQYWRAAPDGNYCAFSRVGIVPALYNEITAAVADGYREIFNDEIPGYALQSYDSIWILATAMEKAGTIEDADAIVKVIEEIDLDLALGHYYFKYGSHNPEIEEGDPLYMWHQWPDPIVTMMQYFEPGQTGTDAAVIWPEVYQTHGTAYIEPGTTPGE